MKVVIVGAGIGGVTAALALAQRGIEVDLYERADELLPLGAGLSLWSNAMRCLGEVGLEQRLCEVGTEIKTAEIRTRRGAVLSRIPVQEVSKELGHPSICVRRSILQDTLIDALPDGVLNLGYELVGFTQDEHGVTAQFDNGRETHGDVLIGADGLRSSIRAQMINDGEPRYAGYGGWLGLAQFAHPALPSGLAFESWGRGERFGMLNCGPDAVYWFCARNRRDPKAGASKGRKDEVLRVAQGWHEPVPDVVNATEEDQIVELSFFDRRPLRRWAVGRIALLGDAAHPMTPNLGQGACQAIEDAVALAECLHSESDPVGGLQAYENRRIKRSSLFVQRSRRLGSLLQSERVVTCRLRNVLLQLTPDVFQVWQMVRQFNSDREGRQTKTCGRCRANRG